MCYLSLLENFNISISALISVIGLVFDIIGVYKIFINTDKPYGYFKKDITELEWVSSLQWDKSSSPTGKEVDASFNLLTDHMNKKISDINKDNEAIRKKNKKWFRLILVGFVLQIIGTIIAF